MSITINSVVTIISAVTRTNIVINEEMIELDILIANNKIFLEVDFFTQ